jgi:methionine sulfoxide reductase heme-binding subunit
VAGLTSFLHGPFLWYATRAAGLVTLVLLTASMALGILNAGRFGTRRWPRFLVQGLHRNLSLLALAFLALHVATTVIDTYTSIGLRDAIVPFLSGYKRFWLGLGAIGSDLLIALIVTSLVRQRIGHRLWRGIHWAGYLCWPVAVAHGLGIGTDHAKTWVLALTACCIAAVLAAIGYRVRPVHLRHEDIPPIPDRRLVR